MGWTTSEDFAESDVVEWMETIWPPNLHRRRSRKYKPKPWGKQKVVAQITAIDGEFVKLVVLKSEIVEDKQVVGSVVKPYKVGTTITKKRSTLQRVEPERLLWSEEDVRKALLTEIP